MTVPTDGTYGLTVGRVAHQAIASVLAAGVATDRTERVVQVLQAVHDAIGERPGRSVRTRALVMDAATAVAAYLARFLLPGSWIFVAAEAQLDGLRADVYWRHTRRNLVLLDEIKTGISRALDAALRPQIDAYVNAGASRWGDRFVGVRLCAVSHPRETRLYLPGREYSLRWADVMDKIL